MSSIQAAPASPTASAAEASAWPAVCFDNGALLCVPRVSPTLMVAGFGAELAQEADSIDGIPLEWVHQASDPERADRPADRRADHPNGAVSLDHIVINTDSLERSSAAVEQALGLPLRRVREVGSGPTAIRQGFHRFADRGCILELVERGAASPAGGAQVSVYGAVAITDRLDEIAAELGDDVISAPRAAVQPGRSIATVRAQVGLPIALAFMSPEPPRC